MAAVAALMGIAWGRPVIVLWAAAVGTIGLGAAWWARAAWTGVDVQAEFRPPRSFAGEPVELVVRVINAKRLPLPIVRMLIRLPDGLAADAAPDPTGLRGYRRRLSVPGRGEAVLSLPVFAISRGEYWLEDVRMELADPFDLAPIARHVEVERALLVLPEPAGSGAVRIRRWLPFGAPEPGARLFEDRERFAGVRDYAPGDPMHHVHWRLSAHAGRLQTKRFEPTRSAEVLFALDLSAGEPFWRAVDPTAAEETIGWASYLARQAIHAGWRAGIVANTHLRKGRGPLRLAPSAAVGQEAALFRALARMPNQPTNDLWPVLREVGRRMTRRTTIVVISPNPGPGLDREVETLRRRGSEVLLLAPDPAGVG